MEENTTTETTEPQDLDAPVWGAVGIASIIKQSVPQTYRLIEKGELPVKKIGGKLVAIPRKLLERLTP